MSGAVNLESRQLTAPSLASCHRRVPARYRGGRRPPRIDAMSGLVARASSVTWREQPAADIDASRRHGPRPPDRAASLPWHRHAARATESSPCPADLPSAAPATVSLGQTPRTMKCPVKLPPVSGTQSLREAMARSTLASICCTPLAPRSATRLRPELTAGCPPSLDGAANSRSPLPANGRPRNHPTAPRCSAYRAGRPGPLTARGEIEIDAPRPARRGMHRDRSRSPRLRTRPRDRNPLSLQRQPAGALRQSSFRIRPGRCRWRERDVAGIARRTEIQLALGRIVFRRAVDVSFRCSPASCRRAARESRLAPPCRQRARTV